MIIEPLKLGDYSNRVCKSSDSKKDYEKHQSDDKIHNRLERAGIGIIPSTSTTTYTTTPKSNSVTNVSIILFLLVVGLLKHKR